MQFLSIPLLLCRDMNARTDLPGGAEWLFVPGQRDCSAKSDHIIVCGEEKGGTDALLPVVRELVTRGIGVKALMAGIGLQIFRGKIQEYNLSIDAGSQELAADQPPGALLYSPSNDGRIERYLSKAYQGTDSYIIEDHYESSRFAVGLTLDDGLRPPTVCAVDFEAERLIKQRFPHAEVSVVITGSPAFDALHSEDRLLIQQQVKEKLEIADKKLVALILPGLGHTALAAEIAEACQTGADDIVFAVRRHPRDTVDDATIERIFADVNCVDTGRYTTDEVGAAADVVVAQRSTYSLKAAARQVPNIAIPKFIPKGFTLPLVEAGASLAAEPRELPWAIGELLQDSSTRLSQLKEGMKPYKVDGLSAKRVADVVRKASVSEG